MRSRFVPPEILLLGPGPSPVSHEVLAAMAAPPLGHLDPDFTGLMARVQADLRTVFQTTNPMTLPISGTGTAGMETVLVNLLEPGDRAVIGVHGYFGERLVTIARRQGANVVEVRAGYGAALDAAAMQRAIGGGPTRLVAFVHAETSTGVLQPHEAIVRAAKQAGALVAIDCVTSLGGVPVAIDAWGIDAAYSGSQKCLGVPPGLSPVTLSAAAVERLRRRPQPPTSWYLDLLLLETYWGSDRAYHHTAPVNLVFALAAGLDGVLAEGLEARWARHRGIAQSFWRGLEVLGLQCLVPEPLRLPQLTSVRVPDGIDELAARKHLREAHRLEIGGGLGSLKGKVWRVGLMGHGARRESVVRVLAAFGDVLARSGRKVDVQAALRAAFP